MASAGCVAIGPLWLPARPPVGGSVIYPFERFTEKAKRVLTLAQEEAEKSHHSYIGTEHLLLGLLREGEGLAAKVLANLGVEIEKVRDTIDSVLGRNERTIVQQIIPTSRVKKVIEIAFEEAKRMNNTYVGTEHLLLGLLIEADGIAAHVLEDLGANQERVRHELDRLGADPEQAAGPAAPGGARGGRQWLRGFRASSRFLNSQPQAMLSAPATSALALAEEEAARAGGRCGTEHLLLGLLRQGEGKAALVLAALGVELGSCRQAVAGLPLTGEPVTPLVYEPELESALGTSWQLAAEVAGGVVDTDSLLLTICKLPDCRACQVLARLGVDRDQVAARLGPAGEGPPGS